MLKEKEKRTLLIVILGVSLVSLVATLVSGVVSGLMYLVNGEMFNDYATDHIRLMYGLFLLVGMGLGVAYLTFYLVKKNYRNKIALIFLIAQAVYFVITSIVLYLWLAIAQNWYIESVDFAYLGNYIAALLSALISSALITCASHFLHKSNQQEEQSATNETVEKP